MMNTMVRNWWASAVLAAGALALPTPVPAYAAPAASQYYVLKTSDERCIVPKLDKAGKYAGKFIESPCGRDAAMWIVGGEGAESKMVAVTEKDSVGFAYDHESDTVHAVTAPGVNSNLGDFTNIYPGGELSIERAASGGPLHWKDGAFQILTGVGNIKLENLKRQAVTSDVRPAGEPWFQYSLPRPHLGFDCSVGKFGNMGTTWYRNFDVYLPQGATLPPNAEAVISTGSHNEILGLPFLPTDMPWRAAPSGGTNFSANVPGWFVSKRADHAEEGAVRIQINKDVGGTLMAEGGYTIQWMAYNKEYGTWVGSERVTVDLGLGHGAFYCSGEISNNGPA